MPHLKMGLRERERFRGSYLQFLAEEEFPDAGYQPDSSHFYRLTYSKPFDSISSVTKSLRAAPKLLFPSAVGTPFWVCWLWTPLQCPCSWVKALKAVDTTETKGSFDLITGR